jgi:hypothetical protein
VDDVTAGVREELKAEEETLCVNKQGLHRALLAQGRAFGWSRAWHIRGDCAGVHNHSAATGERCPQRLQVEYKTRLVGGTRGPRLEY